MGILGEELAMLRAAGEGRFVWAYGRRRIGKSRLLQEFLESSGIPYVFFQAPKRNPGQALARFRDAVAASTLPASEVVRAGTTFESWPAALSVASQGATADLPVAIVIDELPYLAEHDPGFPADLQVAWDRHLERRPVYLAAAGSDIRMMKLLTEYPSELHGRPTRELDVPPFTPLEVAQLMGAEGADALDRYLVVGGYPLLAISWPASQSRRGFLERALADSSTSFAVNALRVMEAEFEDATQARDVLEAIGAGEVSFTRIRNRSGVRNETSLASALEVLVEKKRMVSAALPYAAPPGKKHKRYTIIDPYLRFWLRFVGPNLDEIDRGRSDLLLDRIERDWEGYRGKAIEPLVRDSVERLLAESGFRRRLGGARYVGGYWTRSNDVEVDLVGADARDPKQVAFVGSIKWRERADFNRRDAEVLMAHRAEVPGAVKAKLLGVARRGFTQDATLDVKLGPGELLGAWRRS